MRCSSVLPDLLPSRILTQTTDDMQAWGLLELQAGNMWAALALLERASRTDARCAPVLRWQPVQAARLAVSSRRQHCSRAKLNAKLRSIA